MSTLNVSNLAGPSSTGTAATLSSINGGPISGARNRIINGDMRIDQRNAGASVTPTANTYTLDRWISVITQTSKFSVQQNAGSITPPAGFSNYLGITSLSAYTVAAGDVFTVSQVIEGYNISDLALGTANAKTFTISFWVRSSLTGTFGGAVTGGQVYPFTYAISSANTWEYKTVTISGSTSGTWNSTNSSGLTLRFSLGAGSTYSGTAGAWSNTDFYSATGATSIVGTNGATFYITGVQLEPGTVATPFERRSYGQELALCQRYFESLNGRYVSSAKTGISDYISWTFKVQKRATPTISYVNSAFGAQDALTVDVTTVLSSTSTAAAIGNGTTSSAEL